MDNLDPEQVQKALRLCDILGFEDITIAVTILEELDWNIEKAVDMMQDNTKTKSEPTKPEKFIDLPRHYTNDTNKQQQSSQDEKLFEYEFDKEKRIKQKTEEFNEEHEELNLDRTATEMPKLEKQLSYDRKIVKQYSKHRHSYQTQLLEDSQKFCKSLLSNKEQLQKVSSSKIKNKNNRDFISYLCKNYRCNINFTFGTFLLNLVRSHLDQKFLLVYIHKMEYEDSRSLRMILAHKEISKFINTNFVSYGMFDNSDDYEIIQKYVPMKDLPAFALFKFSRKLKKQKFIAAYSILTKDPANILEWLAANANVKILKKTEMKQAESKTEDVITHRTIMSSQDEQYHEMERIYKLRRQESMLKKEEIEKAEKAINDMKKKFLEQPKFEQGQVISIKFRLPDTGKSLGRNFKVTDKIQILFDYINCFGRDQFEQRFANFDLTQTFPRISLLSSKQKQIKEIFEASSHENLIVLQL